jgi:hypothetical protein
MELRLATDTLAPDEAVERIISLLRQHGRLP